MGAKSTKNATMCVVKGTATGTDLTPTAATKATPPVITVADVTGMKEGDLITFAPNSTGLESLDGKTFAVGTIDDTASTFEVVGASTANDTGSFAAGADMTNWRDADFQCLCLNQFEITTETPDSISTATFCDPSATIPSSTTAAGSIAIGGYIDKDDAGYHEILEAQEDGKSRMWRIMLPDNGYLVFPGIVAGLGYSIPLEGAQAWTANITLGSRPRHLF